MENRPIDYSKLPNDLKQKLLEIEKHNPANQQLQVLSDVAMMLQEMIHLMDDDKKVNEKSVSDLGALLVDIRESLLTLKDKKAPETVDFSKPVVTAVEKLSREMSNQLSKIDIKPEFKPNISVDAPQVNVRPPDVDLKGVEKLLKNEVPKAFEQAIKTIPKAPKPDYSPLLKAFEGISEQLLSIETATRLKPLPGILKVTNTDGSAISGVSTSPNSANVTSVGDTTSATTLILANSQRKELEFYNTSTAKLYLLKGSGTPSSTNHTVSLSQEDYYNTSSKSDFQGIWASDAGGTVLITESE